jgi:large subunit ribosomal protein L19
VGKRARVRERRFAGAEPVVERELLHARASAPADAPEAEAADGAAPEAAEASSADE